jgi:hypothetical protein
MPSSSCLAGIRLFRRCARRPNAQRTAEQIVAKVSEVKTAQRW